MLRFTVHANGAAGSVDLAAAYLVGSDGVPLRAEMEFTGDVLCCVKRADGPAGIAMLWPVPGVGMILLETSRLVDREKPYNLVLELARGQLMRMSLKREEWGLFDFDGSERVTNEIDKARDVFVEALKQDDPVEQTRIAEQALQMAVLAGEQLGHFHAELFLNRRKQAHAFTKRVLGCTVDVTNTSAEYRKKLVGAFDHAYLPIPWRMLEPKHQEYNWRLFDSWVEWLVKQRMPIKAGPLVSFAPDHLPDWITTYEMDFEAIRNMIFEHVRKVVERYANYVHHWDVVSGIHATNVFGFTFEQVMELTRVTVSLVKQLASRSQAVVDLVMPWGEYYARNQRTIPPMLYADMVVQSGVAFDGVGVKFEFGMAEDGKYMRDMLQISEKLERLGNLGKSLHVTAVQVPSAPTSESIVGAGGCWRKPWDEQVQARWVREFLTVALSKPFVDSVTWKGLADADAPDAFKGGLLNADLSPKLAYTVVKEVRAEIQTVQRKPPAQKPSK